MRKGILLKLICFGGAYSLDLHNCTLCVKNTGIKSIHILADYFHFGQRPTQVPLLSIRFSVKVGN